MRLNLKAIGNYAKSWDDPAKVPAGDMRPLARRASPYPLTSDGIFCTPKMQQLGKVPGGVMPAGETLRL